MILFCQASYPKVNRRVEFHLKQRFALCPKSGRRCHREKGQNILLGGSMVEFFKVFFVIMTSNIVSINRYKTAAKKIPELSGPQIAHDLLRRYERRVR